MKVKEIMTSNPYVLTSDQTIKEAADLFLERQIDGVPVVDKQGKLVGLFCKSQLYRAISEQIDLNQPVMVIMVSDVATIDPDDDIEKVFAINRSRLPVVVDGKVVGILTKSDIMSNYHRKINDLTNKLQTVIASVYNAIISIDKDGRISIFNQAAERIFGKKKEEVIGMPYQDMFTNGRLMEVLATGKTITTDEIVYDGKTMLSNLSPIMQNNKIIGAVSVFQDISELEKISEELRYTRKIKEETDAIFEASYDYIFITDAEGRVQKVNQAYHRITGIKPEEIIGKTMYELVAQGFYDRSCTIEVIETLKPVTFTQKIKTGRTVLVTGNPVFNEKGELTSVITNGRDITELNLLKQEVEHVQGISQHYKKELTKIQGLTGCVINSQIMKDLMDLILHLAKFDSVVLITGESGVGKEIVAHQLYSHSNRKDKQYIRINCAAIPESLLESELFGYADGAFTGAKRGGKMGIFELASGGTLLLDEIGELPLTVQAKLLRVIQENEVIRIGGTNPVKVDVRLITSTNRNLQDMVENKQFREDLFYRLNVVPIRVPPLRERKEEIPALIDHFLKKFNQKYHLNKSLDPRLMDSLMSYEWPGNVRELKNVIERAVVTSPESVIKEIKLCGENHRDCRFEVGPNITMKKVVAAVEKDLIVRYLSKHRTTRKAAAALGISQTTLCRKAAQYNINLRHG